MKPLRIYLPFLLFWLWSVSLIAGKIYTWTDQNGVTHISEEPPPAGGKLEEVIEYTPKTEEEIQRILQQKESRRKERDKASVLQNARKARKIADEAGLAAEEARKRAAEVNQKALDFRKRVGNDTDRIKRNRSRIRKLELEAQQAKEAARQAAEVARQAEEQAKNAEKRAAEMMDQNSNSEKASVESER